MAEPIIVRLINQQDLIVQWLSAKPSWSPEIQQGNLQALAKSIDNSAVILLLPASDVLLLAIDLPVKSNNQIKKALPFALEELMADEMETYHLVWHRQAKGQVYVAAINREKFKACLASFQEYGIKLDSVYSETLCLPYLENSCSLLIEHQNAILRTGQWLGGGIEVEMLPIVLDKIRLDNPNLASLQCWSASEPSQWLSELPFNLTHHTTDPSLLLLESAVTKLTGELNLLTSDFAQKNTQRVPWKKWLPALAIILITALLQTGLFLNSYWQQKTQLASLETQTLSLFKQTFPEVTRIVNIKVQADQQLIDLQKQSTGKGSPFMSLLYQTGQVLSVNPGFEIRQLDYINDSLQVQLIAPTISQVEQVKQQLESSNQLLVKIQSAEANQKGVEVNYEIKQK
jgi:general secretion pathway protein L